MITIVSVKRAQFDTPCRRCGQTITRGRRLALVTGIGAVHVGCLLRRPEQTAPGRDQRQETT